MNRTFVTAGTLAALLVVAGCATGETEAEGADSTWNDSSDMQVVPVQEEGEEDEDAEGDDEEPEDDRPAGPFDLQLTAPDGFAEAPSLEIPTAFAEEYVGYAFEIPDAHDSEKIFVTSYFLPEDTVTETYDDQLDLIYDYDDAISNQSSSGNHSVALVNGEQGIFRYASMEDRNENEDNQQNYFVFADQHVIQITCQWRHQFQTIRAGCFEVLSQFPFPEQWLSNY